MSSLFHFIKIDDLDIMWVGVNIELKYFGVFMKYIWFIRDGFIRSFVSHEQNLESFQFEDATHSL